MLVLGHVFQLRCEGKDDLNINEAHRHLDIKARNLEKASVIIRIN